MEHSKHNPFSLYATMAWQREGERIDQSLGRKGGKKYREKRQKIIWIDKVVATSSWKWHGICQWKCTVAVGRSWKAFAKGFEVDFSAVMMRLGKGGSTSSWPSPFLKQQRTPEQSTSFDGFSQGLTGPSALPWAASCASLSTGSLTQNKLLNSCLLASVSL